MSGGDLTVAGESGFLDGRIAVQLRIIDKDATTTGEWRTKIASSQDFPEYQLCLYNNDL